MRKMNHWLKGIAITAMIAVPNIANAATVSFNNVTTAEYESIVKELSSNFYYTTVSGAQSLGKSFGVEIGAVGGVSKIPDIHRLVTRSNASTTLKDSFPHGNILARITTPFYGLTVEAAAIPTITASDAKFSQWGGALMWTITDVFFTDLPVTLAARGYYKKTNFDYSQTINNSSTGNNDVTANVSLDDSVYGLQATVSKRFLDFIEPYATLGYAKATGDLSIASTVPAATFLNSGTSASASPSSIQMIAGTDIQVGFFTVGAEYARTYSRNSYTGRLSFRF